MQFFLLHFAGGNCYSYDFLLKEIKAKTNIDCYALELPGRGKRYSESIITSMESAIKDYVFQIQEKRNGEPYILYGHSMGATLGFFVIQKMEKIKDPPIEFIASGNPGPGIRYKDYNNKQKKYKLSDIDFKDYLRKLGGTSEEVLMNNELFDLFSPIMRADFQILEENNTISTKPIRTPIYAIMGKQEESAEEIHNWKKYTRAKFYAETLEGNHFFIHNHTVRLVEVVLKINQFQ
ncbi:thioesterase domain-containing protein [Flavobacteriaceae bacterium]|nr:thioesterase domain-containing protein [Flavobacteriaceae bacterium]